MERQPRRVRSELAQLVTITRAKRHDTITYGEIKWSIFDELHMLVDHSMFAELMEAVNEESDGVLLSSLAALPDGIRHPACSPKLTSP